MFVNGDAPENNRRDGLLLNCAAITVGDFMLRAIAAIAGHDVKAIIGSLAGEYGGVAEFAGDRYRPIDVALVKNIVDGIENRLIVFRSPD